jgi:UDP-glucose 4-epimerase
MKSQNWLITGGCGFLGTSLIDHLLKETAATGIRVLDNLSVGQRDDLDEVAAFSEKNLSEIKGRPKGVELIAGDIRDYETCLVSCRGIDVVIHLAANTGVGPSVENPRADMESNVIGTFNVLEAARQNKVDKVVFASSGAPIGEVDPPITEDKPAKPVSPYGASKLAGEGYCSAFFRTFGLKTVSLRFGNAYGPKSKHKNSVVAKFIKQALAGETLEIYGDGRQTRDFIYIDDLIKAICLAVNPNPMSQSSDPGSLIPWGEVFQIATHRETSVNEIILLIKELVENNKGGAVAIKHGESRLGDVKRNYSDISKANRIIGYLPQYDIKAGLKKTYEYFVSNLGK